MVKSKRDFTITGLTNLINNSKALSQLERALSTFKCSINHDEETFLHNKAIQYEKTGLLQFYKKI